MRVVFFGTPAFAADVLSFLIKNQITVVGAVSRPDKPMGRSRTPVPGPVRLVAEEANIPHFQPEKVSAPEFLPILKSFNADLFVVVAYGEIMKQPVLDVPSRACLNVHASILPKYRGAAPIQRAIINGEMESGITIMHMVRKMDAGDMISQIVMPIGENTTYGALEAQMRIVGSNAILEVIHAFSQGDVQATVQNEEEVTFASKLELEDCEINWDHSAKSIHNLIRGVNPEPGAWCVISIDGQMKRLKIFESRVSSEAPLNVRACILSSSKKVLIGCGEGVLELLEVQLEGKKRMSAAEFYRGLPLGKWEII